MSIFDDFIDMFRFLSPASTCPLGNKLQGRLREQTKTRQVNRLSAPIAQAAYAQTIATLSGELRLGMPQDQVTRLLESKVKEGGDPEEFFQPGTVNAKFNDRRVSAILTSKGIVYSVFS